MSVAIGDVNGDGKPDLVVTNASSNTVGMLLGNGDGTFRPAVVYGSGGLIPGSVAIADVNGDGKPDILVANVCGNGDPNCDGSVAVLLGNGNGTFQTAVTYSSGGVGAESVAVADMNGDGKPDLLVADNCIGIGPCAKGRTAGVGVLLGNGDGTFKPAVTHSSGSGSPIYSIAVADVNSDGKLDLLLPNAWDATVGVLLGNGDGTFQTAVTYGSGGVPSAQFEAVAVADVNGDGKPDLIVTSDSAGLNANNGVQWACSWAMGTELSKQR